MDFTDKQQIKQFIEENDIRDIVKLNEFLKGISGAVIEQMLEAERDEHLGYEKHHRSRVAKDNTRNGYSHKRVRSIHGQSNLAPAAIIVAIIGRLLSLPQAFMP